MRPRSAAPSPDSRLEHSLGLLALVARFEPDNLAVRAAALVHDAGHLPLSHTFEGVAELDHHHLGVERISDLRPVVAAHRVDVGDVISLVEGRQPWALHGAAQAVRLDHLEGWLRGAYAHGRTREPPPATLARLCLADGAVDTDLETATHLVELAIGEARWRTSTPNVVATGLVRDLARTLLAGLAPAERRRIAAMTDHEFWALLLAHPRTGPTADAFRRDPVAWTAVPIHPDDDSTAPVPRDIEFELTRLCLDLPLVDGRPFTGDALASADLPALPQRFLIRLDSSRGQALTRRVGWARLHEHTKRPRGARPSLTSAAHPPDPKQDEPSRRAAT